MRKMSEELTSATAEANKLFGQMSEIVQKRVDEGAVEINVADVAREAGLEIDDRIVEELQIDRVILVHPWLPWHCWWPWRPCFPPRAATRPRCGWPARPQGNRFRRCGTG